MFLFNQNLRKEQNSKKSFKTSLNIKVRQSWLWLKICISFFLNIEMPDSVAFVLIFNLWSDSCITIQLVNSSKVPM